MRLRLAIFVWLLAMATAVAQTEEKPAVNIQAITIHASKSETSDTFFDPALKNVQGLIADTPYNTFRAVATTTRMVPFQREAAMPLDEPYTLFVTPLERQPDSRIRLDVRIEMSSDAQRPVNVLKTTCAIAPGRKVLFRGLRRDPGELMVILSAQDSPVPPRRRRPVETKPDSAVKTIPHGAPRTIDLDENEGEQRNGRLNPGTNQSDHSRINQTDYNK